MDVREDGARMGSCSHGCWIARSRCVPRTKSYAVEEMLLYTIYINIVETELRKNSISCCVWWWPANCQVPNKPGIAVETSLEIECYCQRTDVKLIVSFESSHAKKLFFTCMSSTVNEDGLNGPPHDLNDSVG
jgi:hypothetical protein